MIELKNGYKIEVDTYNYSLVQDYIGKDKKGKDIEQRRHFGHFLDLDSTLLAYKRRCLKEQIEEDIVTLDGCINIVQELLERDNDERQS